MAGIYSRCRIGSAPTGHSLCSVCVQRGPVTSGQSKKPAKVKNHRDSADATHGVCATCCGFRLTDLAAPVRWWHGDADAIIPFDDAKQAISYLSNVELILMPNESHLGGFAAADDVLMFLRSHL